MGGTLPRLAARLTSMRLTIVVPVLDEAQHIDAALEALQPLRRAGHEVIVVDGGSGDDTVDRARGGADRVLTAPRGRAAQMNAGAAVAAGDVLVFLHADTRLPADAPDAIATALGGAGRSDAWWGRFDVEIDGRHPLLRVVAWLMNWRSRLTGIATGDQALFVRRATFEALGGFPRLALMEDVAFSARAKRLSAPVSLTQRVRTSGRRWEARGVIRTVVLMWWLRLAFFCGASPEHLERAYYGPR